MARFSDSDNSDGKSKATIWLEMLLERMEGRFDSMSEVLKIPLGIQEMTMDGFRKWWRTADEAARRRAIKEQGLDAVLRMLGPGILG